MEQKRKEERRVREEELRRRRGEIKRWREEGLITALEDRELRRKALEEVNAARDTRRKEQKAAEQAFEAYVDREERILSMLRLLSLHRWDTVVIESGSADGLQTVEEEVPRDLVLDRLTQVVSHRDTVLELASLGDYEVYMEDFNSHLFRLLEVLVEQCMGLAITPNAARYNTSLELIVQDRETAVRTLLSEKPCIAVLANNVQEVELGLIVQGIKVNAEHDAGDTGLRELSVALGPIKEVRLYQPGEAEMAGM